MAMKRRGAKSKEGKMRQTDRPMFSAYSKSQFEKFFQPKKVKTSDPVDDKDPAPTGGDELAPALTPITPMKVHKEKFFQRNNLDKKLKLEI